jgi:hypothetical protein
MIYLLQLRAPLKAHHPAHVHASVHAYTVKTKLQAANCPPAAAVSLQ